MVRTDSRAPIQLTPAITTARPLSRPSLRSNRWGVQKNAYPHPGPPAAIPVPAPPPSKVPDASQKHYRDIAQKFATSDLAKGHFDAAIKATSVHLARLFATDCELLLIRARAYAGKGDRDAASRDYATCLQHHPGNQEALDGLLEITLSASHSRGGQ